MKFRTTGFIFVASVLVLSVFIFKLNVQAKQFKDATIHIESNNEKVSSLTTYPGFHLLVSGAYDDEDYWRGYIDIPFTYATKDPAIATVDQYGQIIGIHYGTTILTVKSVNGKATTCTINVTKQPGGIVKDEIVVQNMPEIVGYGGYCSYVSIDNNFVTPDDTKMIVLPNNEIGIFHHVQLNKDNQNMVFLKYNSSFECIVRKTIVLPYTLWGGVFLGTDGFYYVTVGQNNYEESATKPVFTVIKFDADFNELGRCDITDCYAVAPFLAGNCSMDMSGNTLAIHTSMSRYKSKDGVNHQSNMSFEIDTLTMKRVHIYGSPYASHSLNQFVKFDGNNISYVDHADGYPRAVAFSTLFDAFPLRLSEFEPREMSHINLINIEGSVGDNETGTNIGGFEIGKYHNIVAGVSIPHGQLTSNVGNDTPKNVFVSLISKDGRSSELKWLTNYEESEKTGTLALRLVKINEDEFAVIYQKYSPKGKSIVLKIIDSNGVGLKEMEWNGFFAAAVQPVVYQGDIVWLATKTGSYDDFVNPQKEYVNNFVRISLKGSNSDYADAMPIQMIGTATPTNSKITINGVLKSFDVYTINENNYFKLRDLASVLNGTSKQFDVTWDSSKGVIDLISKTAYSIIGGEMLLGDGEVKNATINTSKVFIDGEEIALTSYNIGGNNYFKLRDIAKSINVGITWDGSTNTIGIRTDMNYSQ